MNMVPQKEFGWGEGVMGEVTSTWNDQAKIVLMFLNNVYIFKPKVNLSDFPSPVICWQPSVLRHLKLQK